MAVAESKTGMSIADMKKLLHMATPEKKLKCAFGLSSDGLALFVVDKIKQPTALEAEMKKENAGVKNLRCGHAFIDPEKGQQVNIVLLKGTAGGGFGKRLIKTLKGTGFNRVHISGKDEDGNEVAEAAGDEEQEAEGGAAAASPAAAAPAPDGGAKPAAAAAPAPDGGAKPSEAPRKDPRSAATVETAKKAWVATLNKLEGEIETLITAMGKAYEGHGFAAQLEKVVKSKIEPTFAKFDRQLLTILDGVINAKERDEQTKAVRAAHKKIQDYKAFLESEPILKKLDANPFHKLNVVQLATGTLTVLDKAVGAML